MLLVSPRDRGHNTVTANVLDTYIRPSVLSVTARNAVREISAFLLQSMTPCGWTPAHAAVQRYSTDQVFMVFFIRLLNTLQTETEKQCGSVSHLGPAALRATLTGQLLRTDPRCSRHYTGTTKPCDDLIGLLLPHAGKPILSRASVISRTYTESQKVIRAGRRTMPQNRCSRKKAVVHCADTSIWLELAPITDLVLSGLKPWFQQWSRKIPVYFCKFDFLFFILLSFYFFIFFLIFVFYFFFVLYFCKWIYSSKGTRKV